MSPKPVCKCKAVNCPVHVMVERGAVQAADDARFAAVAHAVEERDLALERMQNAEDAARALRAQLPDGMEQCTIQFRECEKGHGWLTAKNWVQHGCPTCERDALRTRIAQLEAQ